ncbi:MAG: prolyl oligopeptidase family serine peptidase [Candidatus Gottesmanbacteria bacterium]
MRKITVIVTIVVIILLLSVVLVNKKPNQITRFISPLASDQRGLGPLSIYAFNNLQKKQYSGSDIKIGRVLKNGQGFTSSMFYYQSQEKKVSGLINIPIGEQPANGFPVIIMIRGYVDEEIYYTGVGTQKVGEFLASHGFITLAPDFLGFGESDDTYTDILEDRFIRPVTILDLLASIKNLKQADPNKIGIWGHSNGGQIAISVLEISKKGYPTVLWAPVTEGFPESVLTYMDQLDDLGLKVKKRIDDFVNNYDPGKYSIDNYLSDIKAPLQVHQGTGDEYIEESWTKEFVDKMKSLGREVQYYIYKGDDHNLSNNWDTAVNRSLEFFKKNL